MRTQIGRHDFAKVVRVDVWLSIVLMVVVSFVFSGAAQAQAVDAADTATVSTDGAPDSIDEILVTGDPNRVLPNAPSGSSFGFDKALARNASFGLYHQRGDDRSVRPLRGRGPREARARRLHDDALRHSRRHRRAQRSGRYLLPRHEAPQSAGTRPQRARGDGHDRGRQGAAVADLRHGQDRRLHQHGAEVRPRGRRRLSRRNPQGSRAAISGSYDRARVVVRRGRPVAVPRRARGRLLRLWRSPRNPAPTQRASTSVSGWCRPRRASTT